jgi:hypothetical protein
MAHRKGIEGAANQVFPYRSAHSTSLIVAIGALLVIEATVLHLWLHPSYPVAAWLLSASSVATLWWLVGDHTRYIGGMVTITVNDVVLALGSRWCCVISRAQIVHVYRPSWQDLSDPRSPSAGFLSAMKPMEPNVMIRCDPPAVVRAFGVITKHYASIGLHLDAPDEFVAALNLRDGTEIRDVLG